MNVGELFQKLSYGELSNLSLAIEGGGDIEEASQPKIILYANEGLLRLHSRFVLCEKDVLIEMVDGVTNYHLLSRYAESQWDPEEVPYPYIKDLGREKFEEDVIKILAVYQNDGRDLPLNDAERFNSVFTPQANVLQVPHVRPYGALSVQYQAKHKKLTHEDTEQEIFLPEVLHEAFTAFIAHKVYSHMNTAEATNKAQEHIMNYESLCQDAVEKDLVSSSISTTNTRFYKRGWI